jgi:hypothetical protein
MIQRISPEGTDVLPEVTRIFCRGQLTYTEFSDGTILPLLQGGAFGDDEEADNTDAEADDVDGEEDTDEDDTDEDEGDGPKSKEQSQVKRLTQEAARHRIRAKNWRNKAEKLEGELNELKSSGVSGDEGKKLKTDLEATRKERDSLTEEVKTLKVGQAIRDGMQELNLNQARAKAIIKVIDLDDIDLDEDGQVSGVTEALERVAQDYPEWVISQGDDDDSGANGNGRASGTSSRKPPRKKNSGPDRSKLLSQFPALAASYGGQPGQ